MCEHAGRLNAFSFFESLMRFLNDLFEMIGSVFCDSVAFGS